MSAHAPDRSTPTSVPPYAPAFYPGEVPDSTQPAQHRRSLLGWSPADDPDLPLLRSTVPLAKRLPDGSAAPTAPVARVMSLAAFGTTGQRSLQSGATDRFYAFTHWDLVDLLVVWGGSSAEGLIVIPEAPVVDAAHRAGVPVLGTVFLPQREHGGLTEWADELLIRDEAGGFLLTGRLADAAEVLGFDGWFINFETQLEPDDSSSARARHTAAETLAFVRDLSRRVDHLVWYDSLTRAGRIDWQDGVTAENRDFVATVDGAGPTEVFLNFDWAAVDGHVDATLAEVSDLGRDATDFFFGVDTESYGSDTPVQWRALVDPAGRPRGSIGIYRPEGSMRQIEGWSLEAFEQVESRFWQAPAPTGGQIEAGEDWPGIAALVAPRVARPLPVATAFTTGAGREYRVDGAPSGLGPWHHLAVQDQLPPTRWSCEGADLDPALDWDDAWQGGESLRLRAGPEPGRVLLWRGPAGAPGDDWPVELVASGEARFELLVEDEAGTERVRLEDRGPATSAADDARWRRWAGIVPRAPHGLVSVRLEVTGEDPVRVGALVLGEVPATPPAAPTGLAAQPREDGILLTWDRDPAVHHWEILAGTRLIGLASGGAFLLPPGTATDTVTIRAVSQRWVRSAAATVRG